MIGTGITLLGIAGLSYFQSLLIEPKEDNPKTQKKKNKVNIKNQRNEIQFQMTFSCDLV